MYEPAAARGLKEAGVELVRCAADWQEPHRWVWAQGRFCLLGAAIKRVNEALYEAVVREQPEVCFLWRPRWIHPETVAKIKRETSAKVVSYNNDDPFSPLYTPWRYPRYWAYYKAGLKHTDLALFYRPHNVQEGLAHGAKGAELLMSWFLPYVHRPVELNAQERARYSCDVVFVGHYEDDGRAQMLEGLVKLGLAVNVFGDPISWRGRLPKGLKSGDQAQHVLGDDYAKALCGAKVALCFLSKRNRDVYTQRNFEIPACGVAMLSESTPMLRSLFEAGKEACFFDSAEQLTREALALLGDESYRRGVAQCGYERVYRDGHDIFSRMRGVVNRLNA